MAFSGNLYPGPQFLVLISLKPQIQIFRIVGYSHDAPCVAALTKLRYRLFSDYFSIDEEHSTAQDQM